MAPLARVPLPRPLAPSTGLPVVGDRTREWQVSLVSQEGARTLVRREGCGECAARESAVESASRWTTPDGFPRPDIALVRGPDAATSVRSPRPVPTGGPIVGSHDLLWRRFWSALWTVLVVSGLACGAAASGGAGGLHLIVGRALGWAALALPVGVLMAGVRGRASAGRPPDRVLVLLGLTLEAAAIVRMHEVLGAIF